MRVKTTRLAMKKAADKTKKTKWHNNTGFIGNKSRIVHIADLGYESYLGRDFYQIIPIPGNELLQIHTLQYRTPKDVVFKSRQ